MIFNVHFLSPLEHILPSWLASSRLQWLCWAYALWQLVRTKKCVLWILSVIPHLLRIKLTSKRDIVLVSPVSSVTHVRDKAAIETSKTYSSQDEEKTFWQWIHRPTTFEMVPWEQRQTWPSSWRAVKYQGWYYFTSEQALRRMACLMHWMHLCRYQEHNLIFAEYCELGSVAENISRDDAYRKILSGDYFFDTLSGKAGEAWWLMVVTWIKHVEVNQIWWGGLSIIPPLLQVWGLNRLCNALTVFIILIDFNRNFLHSLYESLFLRFRIWLKSTLPPFKLPGITCFVLFCFSAMCSTRWAPTVTMSKGSEITNAWGNVAGKHIKLYNFSKVKDLEDVTIHNDGGGHYAYADYRNTEQAVVCIQGRTGFVVPTCTLKPFTYANATVNTDIFVE